MEPLTPQSGLHFATRKAWSGEDLISSWNFPCAVKNLGPLLEADRWCSRLFCSELGPTLSLGWYSCIFLSPMGPHTLFELTVTPKNAAPGFFCGEGRPQYMDLPEHSHPWLTLLSSLFTYSSLSCLKLHLKPCAEFLGCARYFPGGQKVTYY